jgi:short-subunit dehydrogenase
MDVIRVVLPVMRKARSGVIINMSSGAGIFTLPMISLYSASKVALEGFSEALSFELLALGIVVVIKQSQQQAWE